MTPCLICGSDAPKVMDATPAPFIAARLGIDPKTKLTLHKCSFCEHQFFLPRLTSVQEHRLYSGYRDDAYNRLRVSVEPTYAEYIPHFADRDSSHHKERIYVLTSIVREKDLNPSVVLDFGGESDGWLARGVFPDAFVDIYDPASCWLRMRYHYDFVVCAHVLEHVADPIFTLDEAVSHLNPGGYLYLEVPLQDLGPTMHEHVSAFTKKTLALLGVGFVLKPMVTREHTYKFPGKKSMGVLFQRGWNLGEDI